MMRVFNRPGYWRALAWALVFFLQSFVGRVRVSPAIATSPNAMILEMWPHQSQRAPNVFFFPVILALCGTRFRMDDAGHVIQLEAWESDQ